MTVINIRIEVQNDDGSVAHQDIIIPASVIQPEVETKQEEVEDVVITEKKKFERKSSVKDDAPTKTVDIDQIRMWATSAIEAKMGDQLKEIMASYSLKKISDIETVGPEIQAELLEKIADLTKPF